MCDSASPATAHAVPFVAAARGPTLALPSSANHGASVVRATRYVDPTGIAALRPPPFQQPFCGKTHAAADFVSRVLAAPSPSAMLPLCPSRGAGSRNASPADSPRSPQSVSTAEEDDSLSSNSQGLSPTRLAVSGTSPSSFGSLLLYSGPLTPSQTPSLSTGAEGTPVPPMGADCAHGLLPPRRPPYMGVNLVEWDAMVARQKKQARDAYRQRQADWCEQQARELLEVAPKARLLMLLSEARRFEARRLDAAHDAVARLPRRAVDGLDASVFGSGRAVLNQLRLVRADTDRSYAVIMRDCVRAFNTLNNPQASAASRQNLATQGIHLLASFLVWSSGVAGGAADASRVLYACRPYTASRRGPGATTEEDLDGWCLSVDSPTTDLVHAAGNASIARNITRTTATGRPVPTALHAQCIKAESISQRRLASIADANNRLRRQAQAAAQPATVTPTLTPSSSIWSSAAPSILSKMVHPKRKAAQRMVGPWEQPVSVAQ